MKPFLVDVPVKVNIWTRPECQRKQFEVIKKARPSILFIQSDGGRNEKEWEAIRKNRLMYDTEVDWECQIYKIYADENQGMYTMGMKVSKYIWSIVDRCILTEDDQIPSVSFFRYCAELLEKYKDDERIAAICGNNVLTQYNAAGEFDYFFTEVGWSVWGIATWRRVWKNWEFPLEYADNMYIRRCMKDNMTPFWFKKAEHYCKGEMYECHPPGFEYFFMASCILQHRLSVVPTKNMISNVGINGEHAKANNRRWMKGPDVFCLPVFEIEGEIRHPKYVIDDRKYGRLYVKKLQHDRIGVKGCIYKLFKVFDLLAHGDFFRVIKRKMKKNLEK